MLFSDVCIPYIPLWRAKETSRFAWVWCPWCPTARIQSLALLFIHLSDLRWGTRGLNLLICEKGIIIVTTLRVVMRIRRRMYIKCFDNAWYIICISYFNFLLAVKFKIKVENSLKWSNNPKDSKWKWSISKQIQKSLIRSSDRLKSTINTWWINFLYEDGILVCDEVIS